MRLVVLRRRDALDEQVEQRAQVALDALLGRRPAGLRVRVGDRELDLLLVRVEVDEQLVDLVDHLGDARVGPVDLVDAQDHGQPGLERLAEHEARLRQRPSEASTSSITPSTIVRPRSTSPPKSAWPGVSTRFSFTSP